MDPFCYNFCFMFFDMPSCLLVAALCSPAGKGLASWLSCEFCFLVFLSLPHMTSRVRCGGT